MLVNCVFVVFVCSSTNKPESFQPEVHHSSRPWGQSETCRGGATRLVSDFIRRPSHRHRTKTRRRRPGARGRLMDHPRRRTRRERSTEHDRSHADEDRKRSECPATNLQPGSDLRGSVRKNVP